MERAIRSFKLDSAGDCTAILSCGHPQHTRHKPPFEIRTWVLTEEGRNSKIGEFLNCVRCDDFELPADFVKFKTSPEFTEVSMPDAIKKDHQTKEGVWGKIVILEGKLLYHVVNNHKFELDPDKPGIILPEVIHHVEPLDKVRFFIEFYKAP